MKELRMNHKNQKAIRECREENESTEREGDDWQDIDFKKEISIQRWVVGLVFLLGIVIGAVIW